MIIVVNVFAFATAVLFYFKKILPFAFLAGSLLWFSLMLTFWVLMPATVYRRAATFKDHFTMNFDEEAFSVGNERGSRSFAWQKVVKFIETPYFFHLYFDARSFFLVPKESFASADEVYALRQLLKQKVTAN